MGLVSAFQNAAARIVGPLIPSSIIARRAPAISFGILQNLTINSVAGAEVAEACIKQMADAIALAHGSPRYFTPGYDSALKAAGITPAAFYEKLIKFHRYEAKRKGEDLGNYIKTCVTDRNFFNTLWQLHNTLPEAQRDDPRVGGDPVARYERQRASMEHDVDMVVQTSEYLGKPTPWETREILTQIDLVQREDTQRRRRILIHHLYGGLGYDTDAMGRDMRVSPYQHISPAYTRFEAIDDLAWDLVDKDRKIPLTTFPLRPQDWKDRPALCDAVLAAIDINPTVYNKRKKTYWEQAYAPAMAQSCTEFAKRYAGRNQTDLNSILQLVRTSEILAKNSGRNLSHFLPGIMPLFNQILATNVHMQGARSDGSNQILDGVERLNTLLRTRMAEPAGEAPPEPPLG